MDPRKYLAVRTGGNPPAVTSGRHGSSGLPYPHTAVKQAPTKRTHRPPAKHAEAYGRTTLSYARGEGPTSGVPSGGRAQSATMGTQLAVRPGCLAAQVCLNPPLDEVLSMLSGSNGV